MTRIDIALGLLGLAFALGGGLALFRPDALRHQAHRGHPTSRTAAEAGGWTLYAIAGLLGALVLAEQPIGHWMLAAGAVGAAILGTLWRRREPFHRLVERLVTRQSATGLRVLGGLLLLIALGWWRLAFLAGD